MPNFRYALRSLAKAPIFTIVASVSLALALAVNTTVFALADAVVHPVVPYHDDGRAFTIRYFSFAKNAATLEDRYDAIRNGLHSAETVVPYYLTPTSIQVGNTIEDELVANIPLELFGIVGVRPGVGRAFNATDTARAAQPVAMISYGLWLSRFHEQPLQRHLTLTVGRGNYEVVGVMPRSMHFPVQDVWLPPGKLVGDSATRRFGPFALVRLNRGETKASATNELNVVFAGLNAAMAPAPAVSGRLIALTGGSSTGSLARAANFMFLAVGTVLLIACANLGTMLIARGMARRREIAIRIALGASRRAIVRQVFAECAIIVGVGIALGALLMLWAVHLLPHYAAPYVPAIGDLAPVPSWRVFTFAVVIAATTLLLAGALPAMRAAATDPAEPIKDGGAASGRVRDRYSPLIIVEVALSTALLMTAALFILFVSRLAGFDFSYAAKQLQIASLDVRSADVPKDSAVGTFFDDLAARMRILPGASNAATVRPEKADGNIVLSEQGLNGERQMLLSGYSAVSPSYLSTLGIPIVDGRDFQAGDRSVETGVVIVDDSAARRLWPDLPSPVGHMIKLGRRESKRPWLRVVGVARSVELKPRTDLDLPPEPRIYVVYGHDKNRRRDLIVRGSSGSTQDVAMLGVAIRHAIERDAPSIRTRTVHRWLEEYDHTRQTSAFLASLFTAFGAFGLVLCAVGMYGVLAYTVRRRVRELATRIALGAQSRDVVRVVLHDVAVTVLAGIGVGAFVALTVTRGLAWGMFNVRYELALALLGAEAILLGVAMLACLGPIRQAIRANPVDILRAS
jgi:ABC-type transport system, involved in lipoprotein release, permease component